MSSFRHVQEKCSVCGAASKHAITLGSGTFGSPDLDMRPAPMLRETMNAWVHECPSCGYTAPHLADKTTVDKEWLRSDEYRGCEGMKLPEGLAKRFYKRHTLLLKEDADQKKPAMWALIRAAWVCDDAGDVKSARALRTKAAGLVSDIIDSWNEGPGIEDFFLIRYDLLRRAGMFEEVIKLCETEKIINENWRSVQGFQKKMAAQKDAKCYKLDYAIKEGKGEGKE